MRFRPFPAPPAPHPLVRAAATLTLAATLGGGLAAAPATLHAQGAPPAAQHATPDYSGTWLLDPARSKFGQMPAPAKMTLAVRHAGTALGVVTSAESPMGAQRDSVDYTIGGAPTVHEVANVGPSTTTVVVEGGQIVTKAMLETQGMQIPVTSRWSLAPDGRTLTIDRAITTPMGEMTMQLVFARQ